jgi:hypothetical protein
VLSSFYMTRRKCAKLKQEHGRILVVVFLLLFGFFLVTAEITVRTVLGGRKVKIRCHDEF